MSSERTPKKSRSGRLSTWLLVGGLVIVLWAVIGVFGPLWIDSNDPGTAGDRFGMVGALFAGLAFLGVIAALVLQRKELSLQREELSLTREQLQGQRIALEGQVELMGQQGLESTLMELVSVLRSLAKDLEGVFVNPGSRGKGLEMVARALRSEARSAQASAIPVEMSFEGFRGRHKMITPSLTLFWAKSELAPFLPYFKVVSRALRLIDTAAIPEDLMLTTTSGGRQFYGELLGAVLDETQLTAILYYVLGPGYPEDAMRALRYGLLDDLQYSAEPQIRDDFRMLVALADLGLPDDDDE